MSQALSDVALDDVKFQALSPEARFGLATLAVAGVSCTKTQLLKAFDSTPGRSGPLRYQHWTRELSRAEFIQPAARGFRASDAMTMELPWRMMGCRDWSAIERAVEELAQVWSYSWGEAGNARAIALLRLRFFDNVPSRFVDAGLSAQGHVDDSHEALLGLLRGADAKRLEKVHPAMLAFIVGNCRMALGAGAQGVPPLTALDEFVRAQGVDDLEEDAESFLPSLRSWVNEALAERALTLGKFDVVRKVTSVGAGRCTALGLALSWLLGQLTAEQFVEARTNAVSQANSLKSKKVKPIWNGLGDVFYLLALLSLGGERNDKEAARLCRSARRQEPQPPYAVFAAHGLYIAQVRCRVKPTSPRVSFVDRTPLCEVLLDILRCWLKPGSEESLILEAWTDHVDEIPEEFLAQFPLDSWLMRQWYPALKRLNPAAAARLEPAAELMKQAAAPNEICLVELVRSKQAWEHLVAALEQLAPSAASATAGAPQQRIAWGLQFHGGHAYIEPRLQTRKGAGYSGGRKIALAKLYAGEFPCEPTQQDRQIASTVVAHQESRYYGRYSDTVYEFGEGALSSLAGHPAVFDLGSGAPLAVEKGQPKVSLVERGNSYCLQCTPATADGVKVDKQGNRVVVYELNAAQLQVFDTIGGQVTIPQEGVSRVREALRAVSGIVLCEDVDGVISDAEQRPPDSKTYLRLSPENGALRVQLLVRPLGEAGPSFSPGSGEESVLATIAGVPLLTQRDLADEGRRARRLIEHAPVLQDYLADDDTSSDGFIESLEHILELVSSLSDLPCEVEWPDGCPYTIKKPKRTQLRMKTTSDVDWLDVELSLELDDAAPVHAQQVLSAVAQQRRFVRLENGDYVELERSLCSQLERLSAFQVKESEPTRVHPLAALTLPQMLEGDAADGRAGHMALASVTGDDLFEAHMKRLKDAFGETVRIPRGLGATLRDYQLEGFRWMVRLSRLGAGACLADDMGLGKTIQALALLLARRSEGPQLVIAPASVLGNWAREVERFAPALKIVQLADLPTGKAGGRQLPALKKSQLVLATYDLAYRECENLESVTWTTLVLDEAQALKNPDALRTQAISRMSAGFKLALSGTPIENHLGELWSAFNIINPGLLGTRAAFGSRFQSPVERDKNPLRLRQLQALVTPFVLRRTKSQVLTELPEKTELTLDVELSAAERELYEASRVDAVARLNANGKSKANGKAPSHIQILAELLRLRQLCCHPKLAFPSSTLQSSKHEALMELVSELKDNGHRALIFSQFVQHLKLVSERLEQANLSYLYLDGSVKTADRARRVAEFQQGDASFFLISLKAGGVGLNLTAADYVIHLDPWWNPAVEDQASDRAHRIGQTRPVTIYRLIAKHTIEEKLVALHEKKRDLADQILANTDVGARLSAEQMLELLRS